MKAAVDAGYGATIAALGGNFQNSWAVEQALTLAQLTNDNALTSQLVAAVTGAMIVLSNAERSEANAMGNATVGAISALHATTVAMQGNVAALAERTATASNQLAEIALRGAETRNALYTVNTSVANDTCSRLDMINGTARDIVAGLAAVRSAVSQIKVGFPVTTEPDVSTQQGGGDGGNGGGSYALGGAFHRGRVIPYALGGAFTSSIVSDPTYFPMSGGRTGLMGEAGPEAIMPLDRAADGSLGVRAIMPAPIAVPGNDNDGEVAAEIRSLHATINSLQQEVAGLRKESKGGQERIAEGTERGVAAYEEQARETRRTRMLDRRRPA